MKYFICLHANVIINKHKINREHANMILNYWNIYFKISGVLKANTIGEQGLDEKKFWNACITCN